MHEPAAPELALIEATSDAARQSMSGGFAAHLWQTTLDLGFRSGPLAEATPADDSAPGEACGDKNTRQGIATWRERMARGSAFAKAAKALGKRGQVAEDGVGLSHIRDWRNPDEWPAGAKPVTRKIQYDDLYRATQIQYQYSDGDDDWVSPFAAENEEGAEPDDPRRAKPSPHVSFDKRILSQSYQYDWLGNTQRTDDDANGFYDRSLGTITNGGANGAPYQLKTANNQAEGGSRTGQLSTKYDVTGNLTELSVGRSGRATASSYMWVSRTWGMA